jgi:hypothetical protein
LHGRSRATLDLIREARAGDHLTPADTLYADALLAPTCRATHDKLRTLLKTTPAHYRGRVALLGVLLARSELQELREELRVHQALFPDDLTGPLFSAWLEVLQNHDLPAALARLDAARNLLDESRAKKLRAFLRGWSELQRTVTSPKSDPVSVLSALRLRPLVGIDQEVFALNAPTVSWFWDIWLQAAKGAAQAQLSFQGPFSILTGFAGPEAALKTLQELCEDSPESFFLFLQGIVELKLAQKAEKAGRSEKARKHAAHAIEVFYQAADAPTVMPHATWRYLALVSGLMLDSGVTAAQIGPAEPAAVARLQRAALRAVTAGRAHHEFRSEQLPAVAAQLPPVLRHALLSQWILEEPDNPIPYRLRAALEQEMKNGTAALVFTLRWCTDLCWPRIPALNEVRKQGERRLAELFFPVRPQSK